LSNSTLRTTDASEMMITRLPSWGDPILPEVWKISEDEINEKFPLPGERQPLKLSDDNECLLMVMSDPFQAVDKDMASLMNSSEPNESDDFSLSCEASDMQDDVEDPFSYSHDADCEEQREGIEDGECSFWDDSFSSDDDMEIESDPEMPPPGPLLEKPLPKIEWVIEAYFNQHQSLCFNLKMSGGAYMQLMADEVIGSVQVLLEDSISTIYFQVQPLDGLSTLVDSSKVIAAVSQILETEPRKRRLEERCEYEEDERRSLSARKILRKPSIGRRRPKDCAEESRKRHTRLSFAWKALSGRAKTRPKQLARVE
jgi:hypothetical protein